MEAAQPWDSTVGSVVIWNLAHKSISKKNAFIQSFAIDNSGALVDSFSK